MKTQWNSCALTQKGFETCNFIAFFALNFDESAFEIQIETNKDNQIQLSSLNQIMTVSIELTDTSSNQILQNDNLVIFVQFQNITDQE